MPKKVLVVEDSAAMRSLISSTVEELSGYETVEAGNGFEALKALPAHRFDLIITDINMPDINGLEIVNFVKNNSAYKSIPMIIVTTEQGDEDRKKGLALGAAEYITKPFDPEKLKTIVKKFTHG
ncbi:MAG TPA: response regulator [Nitrospiria bacterium]|nr:response regulator [Nitrospiria bacterium]